MASLMENLVDTLEEINGEYVNLLGLSMKKTPIIVSGKLEELTRITDEEQLVVSRITKLEQKNDGILKDIAKVINTDVENVKLDGLIQMMERRPAEQKRLADVRDKLKSTVYQVKRTNEQNGELIKEALEMVQFDLNMLQAMKAAPETANYNKSAYNDGSIMGQNVSGFDARQ